MKKLLGLITVLLFTATTIGFAVNFNLQTSYNAFSDSRISGAGFAFGVSSKITDDTNVGFLAEQSNNTLTGAVGATPANTNRLNLSINAITIDKEVASIGDLTGSVGIEVGSLNATPLAGTLPAVPGLGQNVPLGGLSLTASYGKAGKILSNITLTLKYRFADISDTALVVFPAAEAVVTNLNSLSIAIGITLGY